MKCQADLLLIILLPSGKRSAGLSQDSEQRADLGRSGFTATQEVYNKDKTAFAWIKLIEGLCSE